MAVSTARNHAMSGMHITVHWGCKLKRIFAVQALKAKKATPITGADVGALINHHNVIVCMSSTVHHPAIQHTSSYAKVGPHSSWMSQHYLYAQS